MSPTRLRKIVEEEIALQTQAEAQVAKAKSVVAKPEKTAVFKEEGVADAMAEASTMAAVKVEESATRAEVGEVAEAATEPRMKRKYVRTPDGACPVCWRFLVVAQKVWNTQITKD